MKSFLSKLNLAGCNLEPVTNPPDPPILPLLVLFKIRQTECCYKHFCVTIVNNAVSCSVGSWLALDQPFISSCNDSTLDSSEEICLEYGSATQLYMVPFIQHEEQVINLISSP